MNYSNANDDEINWIDLWGSPPPTPGVDTNGSRPQTQLSNLTAGSSRSTSPDWNTKYGSWNDSAAGWRNDTRHSDGSDVMCTYDSATTNKWMQGPIGAGSPSIGQCSSIWNSAQRQTNPAYDSRADQHAISYDQRPGTIDSSLALEKLAEQFQEFKLKPQILTKRISDRKIKANMRKPACIECVFCKNNEESEKVYKSHVLKDVYGRIQCPVLRMYRCPICGNPGGDEAHTIRYCPKSKSRIGKLENLNSWKKVEKRKFAWSRSNHVMSSQSSECVTTRSSTRNLPAKSLKCKLLPSINLVLSFLSFTMW